MARMLLLIEIQECALDEFAVNFYERQAMELIDRPLGYIGPNLNPKGSIPP
jgi:hypothetical protein